MLSPEPSGSEEQMLNEGAGAREEGQIRHTKGCLCQDDKTAKRDVREK